MIGCSFLPKAALLTSGMSNSSTADIQLPARGCPLTSGMSQTVMLVMLRCRFKPEAEGSEAARRWRDGSLEEDLPMRTLSEMFNVNYFLVSQTNPHIVPALNMKRRVNRKLGNLLEAEWKHRFVMLLCSNAIA